MGEAAMLKDYVAFDLETTGLSVADSRILEIGALKVRNGRVVERFMEFIVQEEPIPAQIIRITGITDTMVAKGRGEPEVMQTFTEFCEDDVLIGHNIMFDFRFTRKFAMLHGYSFDHQGVDTLAIARTVLADLPSRSLESLCSNYNIINNAAHRAYHDALATAKLYQILAHDYEMANEELFLPKVLGSKEKKSRPATKRQKVYLNDLLKYHKIDFKQNIDTMTQSQMSRAIDQIILHHGNMMPVRKG